MDPEKTVQERREEILKIAARRGSNKGAFGWMSQLEHRVI
jgi:hypothetical protein